jgi:hypothetical protein
MKINRVTVGIAAAFLVTMLLGADAPKGPTLKTPAGDLAIFPADNPWNTDVSKLPVHPMSKTWVASIGAGKSLHPDWGANPEGTWGIPYVLVKGDQPKVNVAFDYPDESDKGPYPIPANPPIEGGDSPKNTGDRHVLMIDYENKKLYELWSTYKTDKGWKAGSGAVFDLSSNKLRPATWTSADAAGLPVFPGLVRYDEVVEKGELNHAVRFTIVKSQRGYVLPGRHWASRSSNPNLPPMGMRVRLRADYDVSKFSKNMRVILNGLKKYGMIVADNGGDWFVTGSPDPRWDNEEIDTLKRVKGSDFEVVDTGPVYTDKNHEK